MCWLNRLVANCRLILELIKSLGLSASGGLKCSESLFISEIGVTGLKSYNEVVSSLGRIEKS